MHRATTRSLSALAGGVALVLATAACGGGGDDGPPPEAADLVMLYPSASVHAARDVLESVEWPEGQGTLRSPHADVAISELSVAGAYAPGMSDDEAYGAADGHELLVATFDMADAGQIPDQETAAQMSWAVAVGDRTEAIDPVASGDTVVVSVPEGDAALLQITDEGRTQSLNLRTGVRGDDAVPGLNEPQPSQQLDHPYTGAGVATVVEGMGPAPVDVEVTLARAWRSAWEPTAGWAAPGRAWLVAEVARASYASDDSYVGTIVIGVGLGEGAFTITGPDGVPTPPAVPVTISGVDAFPSYLVFDVPEDATTATLTISPGDGGMAWVEAPPSGQVAIALTAT
jgi:hypothetical protein